MSVAVPFQQSGKRSCFLHCIQVGTLQVLDQRNFIKVAVGDDGEDGFPSKQLMGTETALSSGNNESSARSLFYQDGLLKAHPVDRFSQTAQFFLVEVLTRLVGVG